MSCAAAAGRELAEETGWGEMALRLFLARTDRVRRGLGDVTAMHASDGIAAWRWWTLAELDTTAEVIWPRGLATLIRGTLSRG